MWRAISRDQNFFVVGLGASAGGFAALVEFFDRFFISPHAPKETGLAFVVVTHEQAGHSSQLTELLAQHTTMPVREIHDGDDVYPNHVYVVPPGAAVELSAGSLRLVERLGSLPIDRLFRSLAQDRREHAVGIVFSGTGSDGSDGVREIQSNGGVAMAQTPASATYAGMPQSAIATGRVDYLLSPAELAVELAALVARSSSVSAFDDDGALISIEQLRPVLALLRERTGHDFSPYKSSTVRRRIERRMNVHHIESAVHYVRYLQTSPDELDRLCRDLLIGVTAFFRDAEAFQAFEHALEKKLRSKRSDDPVVRGWVTACSTGEEAYGVAILLRECIERIGRRFDVQLFATDLDAHAIEVARAGSYPDDIVGAVSDARLDRHFVREGAQLRVGKELRDMMVFAVHDVLADPPFMQLDFVSCRNLLIYLDRDAIVELRRLLEEILPENRSFDGFEVTHDFLGLGRKTMLLDARALASEHPNGSMLLVFRMGLDAGLDAVSTPARVGGEA